MPQNWIKPLELEGTVVRLLPMLPEHEKELIEASSDGKLWKLWYTQIPDPDAMSNYISSALKEQRRERAFPFVVLHKESDRIIGSTRFMNVEAEHLRLEIGATWYAESFQRTAVNSECKFLLLRHAFESLHCNAVEFRTHWHNTKSRNAIERLGAKQDGVLRSHQITQDGSIRDTVVYSILKSEWPAVKKSLSKHLNIS